VVFFKLNTSNALTVLHTFTRDGNGEFPSNDLVSVNGEIYGTVEGGGSSGEGAIYRITKTGHYTLVHGFELGNTPDTQSDLVRDSAGNIYGDTYHSLYKLDPAGNFSALYTFSGGTNNPVDPVGRLILGSSGTITGASQFPYSPTRLRTSLPVGD
jgi:uncharacterized repeat protein (TIGR03803 family)